MPQKRAIVFSLAWAPFESGGEIAPRKIIEMNADIHFDVVTHKFDASWPSFETKNNLSIYRVGWPTKYGYIAGGFVKAVQLSLKHKYDFSWSIMAGYSGCIALWYKIFFSKTPLLLTLQEGDSKEHILNRVRFLRPFFRLLFKKADAVQAISNFLANWGKEMGFTGTPVVIPNGVDVPATLGAPSPAPRTWGSERQVILISNSRLEKKNGLDIVIRALKLLPEKFVFKNAHQGSERENLLTLAKEIGVADRVTLDPVMPHEAAVEYLKQGDIFVRPSRSEGLGASFLEAMALGLPIIGTPVGGIPDFLKDGETGVFCEPENSESFARAVMRLTENPILYDAVRKNAYALMKEKFSWSSVGERMSKLFKTL